MGSLKTSDLGVDRFSGASPPHAPNRDGEATPTYRARDIVPKSTTSAVSLALLRRQLTNPRGSAARRAFFRFHQKRPNLKRFPRFHPGVHPLTIGPPSCPAPRVVTSVLITLAITADHLPGRRLRGIFDRYLIFRIMCHAVPPGATRFTLKCVGQPTVLQGMCISEMLVAIDRTLFHLALPPQQTHSRFRYSVFGTTISFFSSRIFPWATEQTGYTQRCTRPHDILSPI